MEDSQEEYFGRFLKLNSFLGTYAADFAANPLIAAEKVKIATLINNIGLQDAIANSDDTGFTLMKTNAANILRTSCKDVSGGLTSYFEITGHAGNREKAKMTDSAIDYPDDAKLNMAANQLYLLGNVPAVKTDPLLATALLTPADIDDLEVNRLAWMALVTLPDDKRADRVAANKEKARLFEVGNKEIVPRLANFMLPYATNNTVLYSKYETANAIDNMGGGSGSDGFDVNTLTIPPGGSLIVPTGPGALDPALEIYIRSVQGSERLCTTNLPASPCVAGFVAQQGVTYKGPLTGLGIDLNLPVLQITNLSNDDDAILRIGFKVE